MSIYGRIRCNLYIFILQYSKINSQLLNKIANIVCLSQGQPKGNIKNNFYLAFVGVLEKVIFSTESYS